MIEKDIFKNLFEFEKKSKVKAGEGKEIGNYPFYTSSELLTKFIDRAEYKGDALIFGTGGKPSIHYNSGNFSVSTDCFVTKSKSGNVLTPFVYYYLAGNIHLLAAGFKGAGLKHISKHYIGNLEIPLPPLPQQKAIAEKLDKADALRKKDHELLKQYDELAQSVFIEMFGDPVRNEKGWEVICLKEICTVKGGKRVPLKHKLVKQNTGFPYIKAGNIKNGKVTLQNLEFLLPETQKLISRYTVDEGDVCITVVGANIGDIGIVPKELHMANLTENADKLLIRDKTKLHNHFLCYQLQSNFVQKQIEKKTMAVGVPKLAIFRVEELEVLLPPLFLQQKFSSIIENIEQQKRNVKLQAEESENLFQALLQESFSN